MKLKTIIWTAAVCSTLSIQAQTISKDTLLRREMLLEKEYNPTIMDASRINYLPEIKDPQTRKAIIEYSNYALPFPVQPHLMPIRANELYTDVVESKKKGYATLGVGTNLEVDADLGYRILHTEKDQLDIFASHHSVNGKVKYLQNKDEKQQVKMNDTWAALAYTHHFDLFRLFTDMKYTNSGFNYYGYQMIPENKPAGYILPPLDKDVRQINNLFNLNVGMVSQDKQDLNYLVKFNYILFNQAYATSKELDGPEESQGKFDWDVNWRFSGDNKLGLGGYIQGISYGYSQPENQRYYYGYKGYGSLSLNPYVTLEDVSWKARIGAKAHFYFDHGDVFSIAPDLALSVYPTADAEIYLSATGGITTNTNYNLFYENRYMNPQVRVADTRTVIDAVFGYRMNIQRNFWFDLFAGYRIDKDAHFFRPVYPDNYPFRTAIAGNVALSDTMDANLFKIGFQTKYRVLEQFEFGLRAQYNIWDVDDFNNPDEVARKDARAWSKPAFESDFSAAYTFGLPLRLDLTYHLETGRKTLVNQIDYGVTPNVEEKQIVKMKNINDLALTATYTFNPSFSAYLKLNNILSQHYDLWYGYPAQQAGLVVGGSFKF